MYYAITFILCIAFFIICDRVKNKTESEIEASFTRNVKYRGYCGVLTFSAPYHTFKIKITAIAEEIRLPNNEPFLNIRELKGSDVVTLDEHTEYAVLVRFFRYVDYRLDPEEENEQKDYMKAYDSLLSKMMKMEKNTEDCKWNR